MSKTNIEERVRAIVADQLGLFIGEAADSDNLAEKFHMDDLDQLEIVMSVEDDFGFEITTAFESTWQTTQQLIDYVTHATLQI